VPAPACRAARAGRPFNWLLGGCGSSDQSIETSPARASWLPIRSIASSSSSIARRIDQPPSNWAPSSPPAGLGLAAGVDAVPISSPSVSASSGAANRLVRDPRSYFATVVRFAATRCSMNPVNRVQDSLISANWNSSILSNGWDAPETCAGQRICPSAPDGLCSQGRDRGQ
jgi:hypothetical protein